MLIKHRPGESYQHAAARTVFVEWLNLSDGRFGPFHWRSDNGNVWEEFPFIKDVSEPINNGMSYAPSYEELKAANVYPIAIADIAIEHKGMIVCAIEIVHKHDISEEKIAKLKKLKSCVEMEIWRVEAHWILSQVGVPTEFPDACIRRVDRYDVPDWREPLVLGWPFNKTL